jgi:hypothetical protein
MSSKKKYEHVSWDRGCYSFQKFKRCDIEYPPISSSSLNDAPSSSCIQKAIEQVMSLFYIIRVPASLHHFHHVLLLKVETRMRRAPSGQLAVTNLQFHECQMNLPRVLRRVLCPIGKGNFENHISGQGMKCVFEGHLVARRSNEITCP